MYKNIICDLDGTLADLKHRLEFVKRDKPDWQTFHDHCVYDKPIQPIINLVDSLYRDSYKIHIVSGRSDRVKKHTIDWLAQHVPFKFELTMRAEGDYTKDNELKERWLNEGLLGPKHHILLCLDDRQRVVDMWRKNGLTCLQVDQWEEYP